MEGDAAVMMRTKMMKDVVHQDHRQCGLSDFEDFHIKAKLWLATTKVKPKARGPLILKSLTGAPFEHYKHLAKNGAWLADPRNAESLLEDMNRPENYGDDRQEHRRE